MWLEDFSRVQRQVRADANVPCGKCNACCRSSYFIYIRREEQPTLDCIPERYLTPAPQPFVGDLVMHPDSDGRCPMLIGNRCSIYSVRPQTCRNYDCRAFAAAGLDLRDARQSAVQRRVAQWSFTYPSAVDLRRHQAVRVAARFMERHGTRVDPGLSVVDPGELAKAAIAVHSLFLQAERPQIAVTRFDDQQLVEAASRRLRRFWGR